MKYRLITIFRNSTRPTLVGNLSRMECLWCSGNFQTTFHQKVIATFPLLVSSEVKLYCFQPIHTSWNSQSDVTYFVEWDAKRQRDIGWHVKSIWHAQRVIYCSVSKSANALDIFTPWIPAQSYLSATKSWWHVCVVWPISRWTMASWYNPMNCSGYTQRVIDCTYQKG